MSTTTKEPQQGMRRHKLLTADARRRLPALGETDGQGFAAIAQVKFFSAVGRYTFFATEFDGDDTLYGYALSPLGPDADEWGYSSLRDLAEQSWRGRMPLIERDCYWSPRSVGEAVGR